jgi:hypothetical protein
MTDVVIPGETEVLQHLVSWLMATDPPLPWAGLVAEARTAVAATYFLLDAVSPASTPHGYEATSPVTVTQFVNVTLPRLLQRLRRRTEQHRVTYQGQVRGRVDWSHTLKDQHSQDCNPNRYVCREVRHQHDTPENQLLKFTVVKIYECLRLVPPILRHGRCYSPAKKQPPTVQWTTAERLEDIESALVRTHAINRLRNITLPLTISEAHVIQAHRSRTGEYAAAAALYDCYHRIVVDHSWPALVAVGQRVLPLPGTAGSESEPWIQLGASVLSARISQDSIKVHVTS